MFHLMLSRGPTPPVTPSFRFNAQHDVEEISASMEGALTRGDRRWLKRACLERDGGRCVVTGQYDENEIEKLPPHQRVLHIVCSTDAAHIIPFALGSSVVRLLFFFYNKKKAKKAKELLLILDE